MNAKLINGLFLIWLTCLSFTSVGQNQVVQGVVMSSKTFLNLHKVQVCINGDLQCLKTNKEGRFYTFITEDVAIDSIRFSVTGFADTTLYFSDVVPNMIQVFMRFEPTAEASTYFKKKTFVGGAFSLGGDWANLGFDGFDTYFPNYVIDSLNKRNDRITLCYDMILNRFQFGFRFGVSSKGQPLGADSMEVRTGSVMYELHGAYNVVRTKYVTMGPMLGLKWFRQRLLITSGQDVIDLPEYLATGEVDLRFHQLTAFLGAHIMLKPYREGQKDGANFFLGAYVGYLVPLSAEPWIRTRSNKINATGSFDFPQVNFGVYFGLVNDGWKRKNPVLR